ncbi:hypothetical protein [Streptomyces sp. NPDC048489]|uniref:hypothetical protein n=1 Tax=Streptomyces sp. NPDC048489 TaxID=3154504 RepID=UPI003422EE62
MKYELVIQTGTKWPISRRGLQSERAQEGNNRSGSRCQNTSEQHKEETAPVRRTLTKLATAQLESQQHPRDDDSPYTSGGSTPSKHPEDGIGISAGIKSTREFDEGRSASCHRKSPI